MNPKYDVSRDSRLFTTLLVPSMKASLPQGEKPRGRRLVKDVQNLLRARYEVFAEMAGNSSFGFSLRVGLCK